MQKKPWNLVVFVVNGKTMNNLKGLDGRPVVEGFRQVSLMVDHVGQDNVVIVFTGVESEVQKDTINRWLLDHSFFDKGKSGMLYNKLLFLSETDGPGIYDKAYERYRFDSYANTVWISDDYAVLTAPTQGEQEMTRAFCDMGHERVVGSQPDPASVFRIFTLKELTEKPEQFLARRR